MNNRVPDLCSKYRRLPAIKQAANNLPLCITASPERYCANSVPCVTVESTFQGFFSEQEHKNASRVVNERRV